MLSTEIIMIKLENYGKLHLNSTKFLFTYTYDYVQIKQKLLFLINQSISLLV